MLSGLLNITLSARKRSSAALEEDQGDQASITSESMEATPSRSRTARRPSSSSKPRKPRAKSVARSTHIPSPEPELTPEQLASNALKNLVQTYPPKSFHSDLLKRLDAATPEQVTALSGLLEGLTPPPVLHCARCHHDYLEEDNYDRSCVMDHDDNATSVARDGQTTWGCCGNTTEDQDPPAGWCYEGKHTADRAMARYRDDYVDDETDDGLQSCEQKRCKRHSPTKFNEVHVVITRRRGERAPPTKRKRLS